MFLTKIKKAFNKRSGTTSKGTDFENVHIANFVLQLVSNPKIEDFHLSSNDERYGAFDDIVVETVCEHGKEIYALQLKHKDKQTLALKSLKQNKGDFGIVKYFESFQKCDEGSQKFVLFTNLKFDIKDNKPFQLEGEDFYVTLSKCYPKGVFKISEDTNYCYKFSIVEDADSARIRQYKTFFDNFFLYADQKNVRNIKVSTEERFREMFLSNKMEFETYLKMISEWSLQEGKKEKLNKEWMQRAIAIHLLSSRTKPLCFGEVNENRKILRQAISDFDITVFEKDTNGKVGELWGDAKKEINDLREINRIRIKYQLSSTRIDNLDNADPKLLSQLFWIMGKCPLIVSEDQTVYKAIKLCLKDKFIVLGKGLLEKWQKHFSVFQDLSDLQRESNVYKHIMENFSCSLQGKEARSLQVLFKQNQEVLNCVKTDNLLEMLGGPCNLGGPKEILPEPYIDRFLWQNVIDFRYLENGNEDTLIILNCGNKLEDVKRKLTDHKFINIDDYLNESITDELSNEENINGKSLNFKISLEESGFGSTIYTSKDDCNFDTFKAIFNKNKDAKICHQFRYRADGNLDWIRSKNDVSDLENYKICNESVDEKIMWSSQPDNNINIIIGDPGMGKTELMKSLKNNCCSEFWTIVVYPKDIYSFLKNSKNRPEAFEEFISNKKSESFKTLDKEICKTSTIIYVWDALDEISSEHLEAVTHIILQLSKKNVLQWVTSRQHLKKFLETKFNVLSITIKQFNEEEQKFYIKKRLAATSKEESDQIINKIQSAFTLVEHKDVLGIPLQIFMLTELFRQNKNKYLDLLNSAFALTDLYHYYIEEKTTIYYKEKAGMDPQNFQSQILVDELKHRTLENYEKFALKALFPEDILSRLDIKCDIELRNNSAVGIITEVKNDIPRFLHASFAEYLVAVYFSKHLALKDIWVDVMFQQKHVNIRFFFDLILAKTSPPHIAILYRNFDFLKKCDKKLLKRKDAGGRNLLQLCCCWGRRHPPLKVEKSADTYLIDDVNDYEATAETAEYLDMIEYLADECNLLENDTCFYMTPLSYAQKSDCLFAQLKLLQKQKTQLSSSDSASINILYYSARFGYSDALDLFTAENLPFIKTKKEGQSLLHLAGSHKNYMVKLFETDIYRAKIDDDDVRGKTSLHFTTYNNSHETTTVLIKQGAQINVGDNNGATPLLAASHNGHDQIVEILIESGADPNLAMNNGVTPLYIASQNGHDKIVEILIKSGADINLAQEKGSAPLHIASQQGHERIVEILANSGADINIATKAGTTPLLFASQQGHDKIVEILLKFGVNINLARNDSVTPLFIASQRGDEKIVEILIKSGADLNLAVSDGATPIFIASQKEHEKVVETLIKVGSDINLATTAGATPLFMASQKGNEKIVEILIKSGADLNRAMNDGATPVFMACQKGNEKIVETLIKSGADLNLAMNNGATPLFMACQKGNEKVVEIIKSGADLNLAMNNGATPLFMACQKGHEKVVETLIKVGADINRAMNNGATPLLFSSQEGLEKMVEILVKFGADINLAKNDGGTPLFMASQRGHEEVVEILTKFGADINLAMNDGATPLVIASQKGHEKIVAILIKSGARINLALNNGATPLFIASRFGFEKIVEILIKSGAETNLVTKSGASALLVAAQNGYERIVEILIESGADMNLGYNDGTTPFFIACLKGHYKTVAILIKYGVNANLVTKSGSTTLLIACQFGHEEIVKILIESGADVNQARNDSATPVFFACQQGHGRVVEILIKARADINLPMNNGATPLFAASQMAHEKIVETLIKVGANINPVKDNGATPLFIASQKGLDNIVKILTKAGADLNLTMSDGATPLLIASQNAHEKVVEILINAGANINLAMNGGATPLFIASQRGHDKIVDILIKFGADLNLTMRDGATPLFIASQKGLEKTVEILIKAGADINLPMNDRATPLLIASQNKHENIVDTLIKSGANINFPMNNGATPLFIACQKGHQKIVEILIKSGADMNLARNDGATPLLIAAQNGHVLIVNILRKFGADINLARNDGATPLFVASQKGYTKIVELLLLSHADVNLARNDGTTPLDVASQKKNTNVVYLITTVSSVANKKEKASKKKCTLL